MKKVSGKKNAKRSNVERMEKLVQGRKDGGKTKEKYRARLLNEKKYINDDSRNI